MEEKLRSLNEASKMLSKETLGKIKGELETKTRPAKSPELLSRKPVKAKTKSKIQGLKTASKKAEKTKKVAKGTKKVVSMTKDAALSVANPSHIPLKVLKKAAKKALEMGKQDMKRSQQQGRER